MTTPTNIRDHLGITENDHNNLIIDSGVDYLRTQPIWTTIGRDSLLRSRVYWQWWWRNWLAVDEAMLRNPLAKMAVDEYLRHHCQAHAYEMPRAMWGKAIFNAEKAITEVCYD